MAAVWPINCATRDSLELSVFLNIALNSHNTSNATASAPKKEIGALIQTLLVASILEKIKPIAPNAVTKLASTVGLKNEIPGTPSLPTPPSACPSVPTTSCPPNKCPKTALNNVKIKPATKQ